MEKTEMENTTRPVLADIPPEENIVTITMKPTEEQISRLSTLMQKGCYVKVECGKTMRDILCRQFGISPEYVRVDIKVMFLDYSPVDDIDTAVIKDGATLALSAAMPGLVGAAMRKDGLSWMRSSITYHEDENKLQEQPGLIQLKLFNQVMADLGESFLKRGVYIKSRYLLGFLKRFTPEFWQEVGKISRNDNLVTGQDLQNYLQDHDEWVRFTVA